MSSWSLTVGALLGLGLVGCVNPRPVPPPPPSNLAPASLTAPTLPRTTSKPESSRESTTGPIQTVAALEQAPAKKSDDAAPSKSAQDEPPLVRPAYAQLETLPIDLTTVIRLVDANNPGIAFAQARVREAEARLEQAEVLWLPNLSVGTSYLRFDGQTQNQRGEVFSKSRANLFTSGGASLSLDVAEAIYRPLIERRLVSAEQFRAQYVALGTAYEGVSAYLDLVQIYAQLEINADTLKKAEAMHQAALNAQNAKLDRTAGDLNRAQSEVLFRRLERIELEGKSGVASARLGRLLLLQPNVKLVPADRAVAPITLIEPQLTLDELLNHAMNYRPDLKANREAIAAALERVRRQAYGPLFPKLAITNQTGAFGGGLNDDLQNFKARNALAAQVFWEVKNLGFGNKAETAERRATLEQAQVSQVEIQARIVSEIVEAAQVTAARFEALDNSKRAVAEALELYRINKEGIFNVIDAKNLFDALRPLQAIQLLNQARSNYLNAVIEYNRAQYRLFTAIGQPPSIGCAN